MCDLAVTELLVFAQHEDFPFGEFEFGERLADPDDGGRVGGCGRLGRGRAWGRVAKLPAALVGEQVECNAIEISADEGARFIPLGRPQHDHESVLGEIFSTSIDRMVKATAKESKERAVIPGKEFREGRARTSLELEHQDLVGGRLLVDRLVDDHGRLERLREPGFESVLHSR